MFRGILYHHESTMTDVHLDLFVRIVDIMLVDNNRPPLFITFCCILHQHDGCFNVNDIVRFLSSIPISKMRNETQKGIEIKEKKRKERTRREQDSNLRGETPFDF